MDFLYNTHMTLYICDFIYIQVHFSFDAITHVGRVQTDFNSRLHDIDVKIEPAQTENQVHDSD